MSTTFQPIVLPIVLGFALALAGCTTLQTASAPADLAANRGPVASTPAAPPAPASAGASAPSAGAPGAPAAPPAAAPPPPPFATVIKDAKQIDGPLTVWQKEDKFWIELTPQQFGQPFLFSPKFKSGIGEAFLFGGLMAYPVSGAGGQQVVEFVRVYNQVRLQARNLDQVAPAGSPAALALASAFSPSLLGSTAVASLPHPERKSVLIEANALFLGDMLGVGMRLQRAFRQNYALDPRNSVISAVRGSAQATVIETQAHFYSATLSVPQPGGPPGAPVPTVPEYVPDTRSLFVNQSFSLAPLPAAPMAARRADQRVGLFANTLLDFGDDLSRTPRQRFVNRWRLEKTDPAAALSEPVKPITFWIDRNMPLKYRAAVREGILEWNQAFERIGFKNAIRAEQQSDDADFDTLDFGYASVRWMVNADPAFGAIGPRHVDPRSGEILDADIGIESLSSRNVRSIRSQVLGPRNEPGAAPEAQACELGALAAEQMGYALDLLAARGEIDPDSPQADQFVLDYLKSVTMHEVGHTLGLRHNFRASRIYTEAQLADREFTLHNGTTGSVMEYAAINLARSGEPGGTPFQLTLGPYDYWAIEYAYRPLAPADEARELLRIAARSNEPLLAFGTDEDNSLGIDPETIQLDLGADPIVFATKRIQIARELFERQEHRFLTPDQDYAVLRRSLNFALNDVGRAVNVLTRQIGGVRTLRDYAGTGREPLQPVPPARQREALDLISRAVLSTEGLRVSPALQRRLVPDYQDRAENVSGAATEFPVAQRLLELQRAVLNQLMSDAVAGRMVDGESQVDRPREGFRLHELVTRLSADVWGELDPARRARIDITAPRRELQREYLNRLGSILLKPAPGTRADARSLWRTQARRLLARIEAAPRAAFSDEARAHLDDSAESLRQALNAQLERAGV
jgi:Met-zincin/Domain of unknown function (DUF5117)